MKKIGRKHLLKTIQKNGVSFFAVAFIAAVSIALYLGILSASNAILKHADAYFVENKLQHFEVSCANGMTQEDVEIISTWDDVDVAEGGYFAMVNTRFAKENVTLQALSLCNHMNTPVVLEGKLPTTVNEVVIEQKFAKERGIQIGDTLVFEHKGELILDNFEVTGIINLPSFGCAIGLETRGISGEGLGFAAYYVGLSQEAFAAEYFGNSFPKVYIRNHQLDDIYSFSNDYKVKEKEIQENLTEFGKERANLRYQELLSQAQPAIDAGLMDAEEIEQKDWIFQGRDNIGDLRSVKGLVDSVSGISYAMSIIFLFVSIVVCHAAISRMIDEQREMLGAQKAMGFTSKEILNHYMAYNLLCAVLGILLGWFIGVVIIENIVLYILAGKFLFGSIMPIFPWKESMIATGICLTIFLVTTYTTCAKLARKPAIELLRGEVSTQKKRYFFEEWQLYKKMKLYSRMMIKNVLNDKGRMVTTTIGVMGSIILLIICFSLKMSIDGAFTKHFDEYFLYENRLVVDTSAADTDEFAEVLDKENISYLLIQDKLRAFRTEGEKWMNGHVVAVNDEELLKDYMVLRDVDTKEIQKLPQDGFLVSRKCAEIYGLHEGSVLEISDSKGNLKECKVVGVIEHFLQNHLFVTSESYYEEVMQEEVDQSVFLLKGEIDGLLDIVSDMEGFMSLKDNSELAEDASSIYMAIGVFLSLSVALAFLVLLNQIAMHINRKARELAVMRINGYTIQETKAYIYKDNIVLTALGLLFGSVVGVIASYIVILIMEREPSSYIHTPSLWACLFACAIEIVFAVIVNIIALRKIEKLNFTNVNGN